MDLFRHPSISPLFVTDQHIQAVLSSFTVAERDNRLAVRSNWSTAFALKAQLYQFFFSRSLAL